MERTHEIYLQLIQFFSSHQLAATFLSSVRLFFKKNTEKIKKKFKIIITLQISNQFNRIPYCGFFSPPPPMAP